MAVKQVLSNALAPLGLSLRHLCLVVLIIQNSVSILVMHHSRVNAVPDGKRYVASTAVFMAEIIKLVVSFSVSFYTTCKSNPSTPPHRLLKPLTSSTFSGESWKLAIPAALYTFQTSLLYIATSNLDAATFQVTYQLKILTTVLFSVILLGRRLSLRQWLALLLLTVGIAIVQLPADFSFDKLKNMALPSRMESRTSSMKKGTSGPVMNASKGIAAVIGASLTSGLVGVYLEKVVKDSLDTVSLWTRNVQLSFYSLFPAFFIGVLWQDGSKITQDGFFSGYSSLVWATILIQAFGGFMVAVCITYTDNIAKNFATSISIVVSTLAGALIFNYIPTRAFVLGTSIVMIAIYLYSGRGRPQAIPLPTHYASNDYARLKSEALAVQVRDLGSDAGYTSSNDDHPLSPVERGIEKIG